ncbi:zinc ribbon domain-containing protein [Bradyrhizobium sp.]|uniref:zinc ribbon domain-containing protein n=1 Tax=Bradyrhizobium sp. TaxID=376 RepID=UPI001DF7FA28|nr:zinc ribbon domain-containing protein [Bradyrhizobium sp.]MBI5323484.1 zinc ribbon domain-containing protein [Bradyrhizobium sp.]
MQCTKCQSEVSENARYCAACGRSLTTSAHCRKCHHPRNNGAFCENCGLRHVPEYEDDSFIEEIAKRILSSLQKKGIGFTHLFMAASTRWLGTMKDGWAGEELAYLVGLFLTYGIVWLNESQLFGAYVFVFALMPYAAYRLLDILSYELKIVFLDRHLDAAKWGGHLLSVDRRMILLFIHLLDFIGCYAILYLGIVALEPKQAFTDPSLKSSVEALYFSVVVASFTGLSAVTPVSAWARLLVMSEILLNLVLLTMLFSTIVGSLGSLTEMMPRPPKAPRIFPHGSHGVIDSDSRDRGRGEAT